MRTGRFFAKRAFALCLLAGAMLVGQNAKSTFENDQVLINERHGQPHDHRFNRVMIYFQAGGEVFHYVDGKDVTVKWGIGEVKWSPASGMHVSEVPANMKVLDVNAPVLVDVGIKKAGTPGKLVTTALDPLRERPRSNSTRWGNSVGTAPADIRLRI